MEGMDHGNHTSNGTQLDHDMTKMGSSLTHMTFFWGKDAEILFSGWPGTRSGMYVLALMLVAVLAFLIEWLSGCEFVKRNSRNKISRGVAQTFVHGVRIGLAYLVMLALMSFNIGVFIAAVVGHAIGFLLFRSSFFKSSSEHDSSGLPK